MWSLLIRYKSDSLSLVIAHLITIALTENEKKKNNIAIQNNEARKIY